MKEYKSKAFSFDGRNWSWAEVKRVTEEANSCCREHNGEIEFVEGHVSHTISGHRFYADPSCWPKYVVYWEEEIGGFVVTYGGEPIRDSDLKVMVFDEKEQAESYVQWGFSEEEKLNIRPVLGRCTRCGSPLVESDFDGYACQCYDCDEDFYAVEQNLKL